MAYIGARFTNSEPDLMPACGVGRYVFTPDRTRPKPKWKQSPGRGRTGEEERSGREGEGEKEREIGGVADSGHWRAVEALG